MPGDPAQKNLDQLVNRLLLARLARTERRRESVGLPVVVGGSVVEAGIALTGTGRRLRVYLLEIGDDLLHRPVQAVEIQTVKTGLPPGVHPLIALVEPLHNGKQVRPDREPGWAGPRTEGTGACRLPTQKRPGRLHRPWWHAVLR
ncbi:MAG: hypothetical protein QOI30_322 [Mycobacterium sp.]|jgi:hypothetical protein|nr:hypothetical protein [Mycobacterium sp.]